MSEISLEAFKRHIRADDIKGDDEKLQMRLDAAEAYVVGATRRTMNELKQMGGGRLPMPVIQAVLMAAAAFDENTQAVQSVQLHVNPLYPALLRQYRKLER